MRHKQYRTIDDFLSHEKLGGWKTPEPERQLSWNEIKELYRKAVTLVKTRETPNSESEYRRVEEKIMMSCLSWTKHGKKPLAVRIHDWLEDNFDIGLLKKHFALRQELWYRAVGWEFSKWRSYISSQYFYSKEEALEKKAEMIDKQIEEAIKEEIGAKEEGTEAAKLEVISRRIGSMTKESGQIWRRLFASAKRANAWYDDYYKQRALLYRWLEWRGLRLSVGDVEFRLSRYVYLGHT